MASRGRRKVSAFLTSSKQKQLAGILLLLLTFVALCYAIVTIANEGQLNLQLRQPPVSETANSSKTTTTVAVTYTNYTNSG